MYVLKDGMDKASESIGINVPIFISDKKWTAVSNGWHADPDISTAIRTSI